MGNSMAVGAGKRTLDMDDAIRQFVDDLDEVVSVLQTGALTHKGLKLIEWAYVEAGRLLWLNRQQKRKTQATRPTKADLIKSHARGAAFKSLDALWKWLKNNRSMSEAMKTDTSVHRELALQRKVAPDTRPHPAQNKASPM